MSASHQVKQRRSQVKQSKYTACNSNNTPRTGQSYDYTLKFLLVGDSDVGKQEILDNLDIHTNDTMDGNPDEQSIYDLPEVTHYSTVILLEGKLIRLLVWDTSGQGRFSTIIRSYSRGAQGILLVYDITNKYSFEGLNRWLAEIETHAPGVVKVLIGNRLHLEFNRQVSEKVAEAYAHKHNMSFFEVSPLCNFNVRESFVELSRVVLQRHGMRSLWRNSNVLSLHELCCRAIVAQTTLYGVEKLPLPGPLKAHLKSYAATAPPSSRLPIKLCFKIYQQPTNSGEKDKDKDTLRRRAKKALFNCDASVSSSANSSADTHARHPRRSSGHREPRRHSRCIIS